MFLAQMVIMELSISYSVTLESQSPLLPWVICINDSENKKSRVVFTIVNNRLLHAFACFTAIEPKTHVSGTQVA